MRFVKSLIDVKVTGGKMHTFVYVVTAEDCV